MFPEDATKPNRYVLLRAGPRDHGGYWPYICTKILPSGHDCPSSKAILMEVVNLYPRHRGGMLYEVRLLCTDTVVAILAAQGALASNV